MKLKHFSLIFSIIGILVLYFLSTLTQPFAISLSEISKFEGKKITAIGIVKHHYSTKHGSQLITIGSNNSSVTVFVEGHLDLEFGDIIEATGTVQKYKDSWEIIVDDHKQIRVLQKWQNLSLPLWQIAQNPQKYLGTNVNITGAVESISNTQFYIVGDKESHNLLVKYNKPGKLELFPGQIVTINGMFSYDETSYTYFIKVFYENHYVRLKTAG
jgi:hypothetical protein